MPATTSTPTTSTPRRTRRPVVAPAIVKGHPNFARAFVKSEADLTAANYAKTLAAGRSAGKKWLDGSDKPLVMMLRAAGIRVAIADKTDRATTIAQYKPLVFAA